MDSTPTIEELKQWKLEKLACLTSTLSFTRYFFKNKNNRRFVIGEHHRIISDALDKVIDGKIKKLIINIAPRYGKTELAVKNFIAKGLAHNPGAKFIHLSYSDDLALDNSEEVREITKEPSYQKLFPEVKIKQGSDSKKKWYTTRGGGVYATSAGGQVTGFGAGAVDDPDADVISDDDFAEWKPGVFSGALIIDDPIKPEDGDSEVIRERVNQRYDSTIKNRINSRNTPIIIIMQRIHENDLCGFLLEKNPDEWTVISLPCIKENGTALWEFKHTIEELRKLEKDNDLVFERQYMQDPKPLKGLAFPKARLNFYKPGVIVESQFESSMGYVDVADEGGDHLCCIVGKNIGDKVYITEVLFTRDNTDTTRPDVASFISRNKINYTRIESNNMGAQFGRDVRKLVPQFTINLINNSVNKHTRIIMQADFVIKYFVFVHPEYQTEQYQKFFKQLTGYLKEKKGEVSDDAPDATTGLALYVRSMLKHLYI